MTETPSGDPTAAYPAYPADPAYPPAETVGAPERGGRRRGLAIGAGAAALALVAGAAVWATTTLSGGGTQPDDVVPKSTFAYVKVDLDPAANQKLAARAYFGKFPKLRDGAGDDEVFENVLDDVVSTEYLDYGDDVRPWLDKRAAVAAFPGGGEGVAHVVAVLRSKDDGTARASLDRVVAKATADGEDVAYRLTRGYAVVGASAAVADAVRLADDASLRDNQTYRDDVGRLDGDQVAVAWVDVGASFRAVKDGLPFAGLLPGIVTDQVKGRLVAGVHLTGDYAEVQGLSLGLDPKARTEGGDHALLTGLPRDTAAAVSGAGIGKVLAGENGALLDSLAGQYLVGSGLSFTRDLVPLLGEELVIAAGATPGGLSSMRVGVVSTTSAGARGRVTAAKISAILGFLGVDVKADLADGKFVLATPADYADELVAGDGGLGDVEAFEQAVGDVRGASLVAYADLAAVRAAFPALRGSGGAEALTAAGLVTGFRGDESYFRLRLVAG